MALGERIKQARKAKNLSMRELASKVNLSPMAISKYERDLIIPSSGVLLRLADALQVRIEYFFRPNSVDIKLDLFRARRSLGKIKIEAIEARIKEWLERYLEIESYLPEEQKLFHHKPFNVDSLEDIENVAINLRNEWGIGLAPIENLIDLLEEKGIKVGLIPGVDEFDACIFNANSSVVIAVKDTIPGDRQRFNIAHELGHIVLKIDKEIDIEKAANRFAGAFLVPQSIAIDELGSHRTRIDINELYILKHKYGLSMQAWIYRAKDLKIISQGAFVKLNRHFRMNRYHKLEPGNPYPIEKPHRMKLLLMRLLAEDILSRTKAEELFGNSLDMLAEGVKQDNVLTARIGT